MWGMPSLGFVYSTLSIPSVKPSVIIRAPTVSTVETNNSRRKPTLLPAPREIKRNNFLSHT